MDLINRYKFFHCRVEDVNLPSKVDVIVSEWMGCFLFFSMIDSVIIARDRWLKPGGMMYPLEAKLYMTPINYHNYFDEKIYFLRNITGGLDFSALIPLAEEEYLHSALKSEHISAENLHKGCEPESCLLKTIDMRKDTLDDIHSTLSPFNFTITLPPSPQRKPFNFHGFALWFEVIFRSPSISEDDKNCVIFSTSPTLPTTHWGNDIFLFSSVPLCSCSNEKVSIKGCVRMTQNEDWKRHYNFLFSFNLSNSLQTISIEKHFSV